MKTVVFRPEVEEDLYELFRILYDKGYLSTYEYAWDYVQRLVREIESRIEVKLKFEAPAYFSKYGKGLKYITYQSTQNTTWYIFFETYDNCYLVTHITNNHVSGQYIR